MEKLELLIHVFARLVPMAVIAIVGALLLAPVLGRWKWLVGEDSPPSAVFFFNCDGCDIEYDIKGSCEYRNWDEDGNKKDYLICQGCYNEILDSWA